VGVVHRDLKPENILLDARGTAKLVDFGLARLSERSERPELGLTEAGTMLGTVHYMAPEQVRGELGDHRIDYFAFGAVLYEMLTGRRAFDARTRAEVISAVLRDQPPSDRALLADERTRRLLGVAFRCLEKAPEHRYQSGAELTDALAGGGSVVTPAPATELPETRYATSSGVHIAYQVVSPAGPPAMIAAAPFISNIEVIWEDRHARDWWRACAAFTHLVHYDRRGVGMSDPVAPECTIDERAEDLRAVLDAEGIERAVLLGFSDGGPSSMGFAVRYPERVLGLMLVDTFARLSRGDDYEHGQPRAEYESLIDRWVVGWGTPRTLTVAMFAASQKADPAFRRWAQRYERQCASPGTVRRLLDQQLGVDVRHLLPQLRCPTLVVHRTGDPAIPVEHGRYLAQHIDGARYVELDSADHAPWYGDGPAMLELIRGFVAEVTSGSQAR
jgi:pimeloyl-ACP methyl ester carboxylesterase